MTEKNHSSNSYQPPISSQPPQYSDNTSHTAVNDADKPAVPRTVRAAFIAICVLGAIHLVSEVYQLFAMPRQTGLVEGIDPEMTGALNTFTNVFAVIIALVITATYFVVAFFVKAGHQWARILAIVLASLSAVATAISLLAMPLLMSFIDSMQGWSEMDAATIQQLEEAKGMLADPLIIVISVLTLVLNIFVIVLLSLRPSSRFYAEMRERKMAHLRASHQYAYNDASVQNGAPVGYNAGYNGQGSADYQNSATQGYTNFSQNSVPTYGAGNSQHAQDAHGYAPAQGSGNIQGNYGYSAPGASPFSGQTTVQHREQPSHQGGSRVADAAYERPADSHGESGQGVSAEAKYAGNNDKTAE